jgi:HD-GYP domain-containing protein (c-di-GMP phosphodiesterase class II)
VTSTSLVLVGQSPELAGLRWQSAQRLRIGRFASGVEVVLNDASVSPHHAEVLQTRMGWVVRDLGSRHGTFVNGQSVNGRQVALSNQDKLQLGRLQLEVLLEQLVEAPPPEGQAAPTIAAPPAPPAPELSGIAIKTTGSFLRIQAAVATTWEQAIENVNPAAGGGGWRDKHVRALLRAGYSVCKATEPDELLQAILDDAVQVLEAQRGSILLVDEETGQLRLRALSLSRPTLRNKGTHSQTLADRCYDRGESILCADVKLEQDLNGVGSVQHGAMYSIVCVLLRTPREKLGVLHLDRGPLQAAFSPQEFHLADALAATVSVGIESALLVSRQQQQFLQTVTALGRAVEIRDLSTANHTNRVTMYSMLLAEELHVGDSERVLLQVGTPLHDIGKIGIEDAVLRKPGALTASEFEHMKTHTLKGAAILETIPGLRSAIPIVRSHHERWDGKGYPDGLPADKIALIARIVAVADAFDAMTSMRPYRKAMTPEEAFGELVSKAGSHFDPACVQAFLARRAHIDAILRQPEPEDNPLERFRKLLQG